MINFGTSQRSRVLMFSHFYDFEVSEIIPYEKGKETMRSVMKAQIEAMKK